MTTLGEAFDARAQRAWGQYQSLKVDVQDLISRFPGAVDVARLEDFSRRAVGIPGTSIVSITAYQLAALLKASVAMASGNIGKARAMSTAPPDVVERNKVEITNLLSSAEGSMRATRALLNGVAVADAATDRARRAVGLGITGAEVAAAIAGAVVLLVGAALLATLIGWVASCVAADRAAAEACARQAATGRPCTGAQYLAFREQALQQQRALLPSLPSLPSIPSLPDLTGPLYLGVAVALGYGIWVTLPAASASRERLRASAAG
jgi:hypothetical protein